MEKLVSVIIPAYNHERYIKGCIDSVINQTYKNLEIIVQDDCSPDSTAKIIKNIKDKRLKKIFSKENKGVVDTINDLVSKCTGEYIAIIGSDDIWDPTKIEKQVKVMEENPKLGAVFTLADIIDQNGDINESEFSSEIFKKDNLSRAKRIRLFFEEGNHLCHPSSLIPKKVMNEIGIYNKAYRQLHDYDYWTRLISKYDIYIIQEKLVSYRHANNKENNVSSVSKINIIRTINEQQNIDNNMILNLDKKTFVEAFGDIIKNKNINSEEELICQKYFVLLNMKQVNVSNKQFAFNLVFNYKNKEKLFNTFKIKYNYSINDFYKDTGLISEVVPIEYLKKYNDLINEQKVLHEILSSNRKEIEDILNSKAWKLIKLFRKIINKMKGSKKNEL